METPQPSDFLRNSARNVFSPHLVIMGNSRILVVPTFDPSWGDRVYAIPPEQRGQLLYTETAIGRSEQGANGIVLRNDSKVSRMHGSIAPITNGGIRVVDYSRNGTRVVEVPEVPVGGTQIRAGSSEYYIVKAQPVIIRCGSAKIRIAKDRDGKLSITIPSKPWDVHTVLGLDQTHTFGSHPENDFILDDRQVARTHGRLRCIGGSVIQVTDGSVQEGQGEGRVIEGTFLERERPPARPS